MSELKEYARQILDSFKKKINVYFESFRSERNVLYLENLVDIKIAPEQSREFMIGIPLEKGKKVDFAMESVEYSMPTVATLTFKNFPLKEVLVRVEFPNVLFGVKGLYPKIIFSSTLVTSWPGDFGLVWLPLTGTDKFAFHPYENRDNKIEDLENFYGDNIVDPLCDFFNSSKHKLAVQIRKSLKSFMDSKDIEVWNYNNPFGKKKEFNIIEVPIYCDFFEANDASILYFECYSLKNYWIPPADIIVEIMQYIGLSTEMFDYDGNLIEDESKLTVIENQVEALDTTTEKLGKKKRAAELKEEWDPFKPVKAVKRDTLGYSVEKKDGTIMKEEHESVLSQVEKMKVLMQQKFTIESEIPTPQPTTPPVAPTPQPTAPPITPTPQPTTPPITPTPQPTTPPITPTPQPTAPPITPTPQPAAPEFQWDDDPKPAAITPQQPATAPQWENKLITKTQTKPRLRGQRPTTSQAPVPAPATQTQPAIPAFANAKDWFNECQMQQALTVGNGSDIPFRERGDFKLIASMPKPFMVTFARDNLRSKKQITSGEVIEILFKFYKSGHIKLL